METGSPGPRLEADPGTGQRLDHPRLKQKTLVPAVWFWATAHLLGAFQPEGSFLLAPSLPSRTQAVFLFQCSWPSPAGAFKTSVSNNLDFGMLQALPRGTPGATAQHSTAASGPTCHFFSALLLS